MNYKYFPFNLTIMVLNSSRSRVRKPHACSALLLLYRLFVRLECEIQNWLDNWTFSQEFKSHFVTLRSARSYGIQEIDLAHVSDKLYQNDIHVTSSKNPRRMNLIFKRNVVAKWNLLTQIAQSRPKFTAKCLSLVSLFS